MTRSEIAHRRLAGQHLTEPVFQSPGEVVAWLGAVQAQDYAGAKWAVAQRMRGATDAAIEQAFDEGALIRTHLLRPTWHFVAPVDLRWILALTAPRVHAANAYWYRKLELDDAVFRRCHDALAGALRAGRQLTRAELGQALERAGINTAGEQRLAYLIMHAELEGVVCSGPRRGKQFTYALVDERVPPAPGLERDEALCELARRYFTTRGPATPHDFAWWSGLTLADARRGVQANGAALEHEEFEGQTYWFATDAPAPAKSTSPAAHLLPNYDEYFIGFKDRSAFAEAVRAAGADEWSETLWANVIVIDGQVVGGWKRTLKPKSVVVELNPVTPLTDGQRRAVEEAAQRYGVFLGLPVEIAYANPA